MNESNLFLDRRGAWGCCWRRWSRWPLKTKTEEEEEMVVGGGKTLVPRGGFWSCDSMSPCSCFIKILGADETTGGGGRGEDQVVVTGKKGLQESCSSLQEEDSLLMSPWMCWNRGGRSCCLQFALPSSPPRELVFIVAVETEELQLRTTAKRSQSSDMVDDLFGFFFWLCWWGERREKETNYGVKDGADFFFVERERESMDVLGSVREESMGGKERALDLLLFSIIYTFDPPKKHVNVLWFSYFFSHFILKTIFWCFDVLFNLYFSFLFFSLFALKFSI